MKKPKAPTIIALETAIDRGGGVVRFSKTLGISHQAIYSWKRRGYVPPDKALAIEHLFSVPREDLMDPALAAIMLAPPAGASDVL